MTSPNREVTGIRCPGCGETYDEWWHASVDVALEEGHRDGAVLSKCPSCGHIIAREQLIVDTDGVLEPAGLEPED